MPFSGRDRRQGKGCGPRSLPRSHGAIIRTATSGIGITLGPRPPRSSAATRGAMFNPRGIRQCELVTRIGEHGEAQARAPGPQPQETVSRSGHSGALLALNRHFCRRFARFVMGISAISVGGLSPGGNEPGESPPRRGGTPALAFRAGAGRLTLSGICLPTAFHPQLQRLQMRTR